MQISSSDIFEQWMFSPLPLAHLLGLVHLHLHITFRTCKQYSLLRNRIDADLIADWPYMKNLLCCAMRIFHKSFCKIEMYNNNKKKSQNIIDLNLTHEFSAI